jgi:hypothetical protein
MQLTRRVATSAPPYQPPAPAPRTERFAWACASELGVEILGSDGSQRFEPYAESVPSRRVA